MRTVASGGIPGVEPDRDGRPWSPTCWRQGCWRGGSTLPSQLAAAFLSEQWARGNPWCAKNGGIARGPHWRRVSARQTLPAEVISTGSIWGWAGALEDAARSFFGTSLPPSSVLERRPLVGLLPSFPTATMPCSKPPKAALKP